MSQSLRVESLTKRFAGLTALGEVSLSLAPGEVLGLMGPNGSGKSTLVNVITGVLAPDGGSVVVDGRDVTGLKPYAVAHCGIARTFQTVRLFKHLSARDNVVAALRNTPHPADKVAEKLLDRLRIGHLRDEPAGRLAYGLQRRLEIARALATDPRYLLLDEPAAGLNDVETADLEGIIRQLVEEFGCGILIIDHDIRLITRLCDRLHVLVNGRTVTEGLPEEVRRHPDVVRAYLGDRGEARQSSSS